MGNLRPIANVRQQSLNTDIVVDGTKGALSHRSFGRGSALQVLHKDVGKNTPRAPQPTPVRQIDPLFARPSFVPFVSSYTRHRSSFIQRKSQPCASNESPIAPPHRVTRPRFHRLAFAPPRALGASFMAESKKTRISSSMVSTGWIVRSRLTSSGSSTVSFRFLAGR